MRLGVPCAPACGGRQAASKRRGNNLKRFQDFHLKAEAKTWPRLCHVCHIHSTPDMEHQQQRTRMIHPWLETSLRAANTANLLCDPTSQLSVQRAERRPPRRSSH